MQKGKSKRTRMHLFLDVGLTVAFVYALRPYKTGLTVHEWLGLVIGLALAVHLVVHWRWVASVTRRIAGGLPARTWATYLLDVALAVAFGTIIVGGVVMSRVVLAQLGLPRMSSEGLSAVHKWASIVTVVLVGVKLALHRAWIRRAFKRTVVDTLRIKLRPEQGVRKPLVFVITGVVVTGLLILSGCDAVQVTGTATGTAPMAMQSPQPTNMPPPTATATATPAPSATATPTMTPSPTATATPTPTPTPTHPLMISVMREQVYPGSALVIEETLSPGFNYDRYVVSYLSEGLKIYALFTVPQGERPETGWPVIVFNHGYIPPDIYRTTERYVAYVDGFARNGYIVIKPDYRGHGFSEGTPVNSVGSPAYTVDVLNAMASAQRYPDADPDRVGMWGHSMGGSITVRAMVVSDEIKAGVIWAGTAASYEAWLTRWRNLFGGRATPTPNADGTPNRRWPERLTESYGSFEANRAFWDAIDPTAHLAQLSGPLQLHHATTDETVPVAFSEDLDALLTEAGVVHELYLYEGDNHSLSGSFGTAMARSVQFFDAYVKGVADD